MDFTVPRRADGDPRRRPRALRRLPGRVLARRSSPTATRRSSSGADRGRLAGRADPGGVRRRGPRRSTAASVILEEINASGGNAGACHAQMYTMGTILRHGSRRAEAALPAADRVGRAAPPGVRRHGADRRLRHDAHPDDGRAGRRRLRRPRPEDLDVARAPLRPDAAARAHDAARRGREADARASRRSSST